MATHKLFINDKTNEVSNTELAGYTNIENKIPKYDRNNKLRVLDENGDAVTDMSIASGDNSGYNNDMNDNERIAKIETRLDGVDTQLTEIKADLRGVRSEISSVKQWILGSTITILLSFAAIIIAFGTYQSSWFQQSINQSEKALTARIEDNRRETDRIIERIEAQAQIANERASEAYIRAEALRLATEWQTQSATP